MEHIAHLNLHGCLFYTVYVTCLRFQPCTMTGTQVFTLPVLWVTQLVLHNGEVFPIVQPERLRRTGIFTARMNNSGFSRTSRGLSIRSELIAGENKWLLTKVAGVCLQPHQARYSQHRRGLQGQRELGKLKISLYCLCVSTASYSQTSRASQVWHPSALRRSW